jgi:hypothetical protein
MNRPLLRSGLASTLLCILACGGARREASIPGPARSASAETHVLTATCRSMSYDGDEMDVITGLSFSLRVVRFHVDETTDVIAGGDSAELTDLAPGTVVRIHYRRTSQGNHADRIEELLDSTEMR